MKRLGMWNRLALVLTVLATVIVPAVVYEDYLSESYKNREVYYQMCRRTNAGTANGDMTAWLKRDAACMDELTKPVTPPSANFYWELTYSTILGCVAVYLIIWAAVATAKWVWRGRQVG